MHATTVAIDLAKEVFELAFADAQGRVMERKRLSRKAFARTLEQRPALRVLMEACGSAHCWGRRFHGQGHTVRLLPARDVRPYVRGNKTDRNDVAGMLEADRCASIASVPVTILGRSVSDPLLPEYPRPTRQELPGTISIMVKGSVPVRTTPITLPAPQAA